MYALLTSRRSGQVEVVDIPEPELRPGGVLVRTHFSVISAGTERAAIEAGAKSLVSRAMDRPDQVRQIVDWARQGGIKATYEKVRSKLDAYTAMGYSCAGEVVGVGDGVTEFRSGDRVACAGLGYASHCEVNFVPRNLAVRVPDNVSLDQAALTTIGAIAVQGLRQANVAFGETIAIIGAGLLGVLAAQIARAAGCRVIAIDLSEERVRRARELGAHFAVSASDPMLAERVRNFSRYGVDAAVLTASSASAEPVELAAKLLRDRGRIAVVGAVGLGVSRDSMYAKELSLTLSRSYGPGRYDSQYEEKGIDYPIGYVRWTEQRNMQAFLDLLGTGQIDVAPLLQQRYPIDRGAEAYSALSSGAYTAVLQYPTTPPAREAPVCKPQPLPGKGEVRIGCIGAGGFATGVVFPHLKGTDGARLEAVASTSGVSAASARKAFHFGRAESVGELLEDPGIDAVFVLSRHDSHARYAGAALERGKAVFVEKPLATNWQELQRLQGIVDACRSRGHTPFVMAGFNRRFAPLTGKVLEFFAARSEPMVIQVRVNAGHVPPDHWIHDDGGRIVGEFCHFVDWARALVGAPIERVSASAAPNGTRYRNDNVAAILNFADGSLASLVYLANGDKSVPKEHFEVFCGGSVARLEDFRWLELASGNKTRRFRTAQDKGHGRELQLTIEAMRSGGPAPIKFEELAEVTAATLLVGEAIRTGAPLCVAGGRQPQPGKAAGADESPWIETGQLAGIRQD